MLRFLGWLCDRVHSQGYPSIDEGQSRAPESRWHRAAGAELPRARRWLTGAACKLAASAQEGAAGFAGRT